MTSATIDLFTLTAVGGTFLLAGAVKGVIGLGLPTVSLGLLTAALDLTTAMALLIVPSFVTNLWQAVIGGNGRAILLRTCPFLLMATATVWLGATALTRVDLSLLSGLPRDMLVQAMGMLFTASTVALALALQGNTLLTTQLSFVSAAAVIPAAVGMATGQHFRRRLPEDRFRRIFFVALFVLGAYIIANATMRSLTAGAREFLINAHFEQSGRSKPVSVLARD